MAIVAREQITIVDLTDSRSMQMFVESSSPRVQIHNVEEKTFIPDWTVSPVVLVPTAFLVGEQKNIIKDATNVVWKRNGTRITESANYSVDPITKALTINRNEMNSNPSVRYTIEADVYDAETEMTASSRAEISFSKLETAESGMNAQNVFLTFPDGSIFKNALEDEEKRISILYYNGAQEVVRGFATKWYYQEPTLTSTDPNYDTDGGEGWSLISDTNNQEGNIRGYTTPTLTVSDKVVVGAESFKAVVKYGGNSPMTVVGTMVDITTPYQVSIEGNLAFREEAEKTNLTARLFLEQHKVEDLTNFSFSWYIHDENGELIGGWSQDGSSIELSKAAISSSGYVSVEVVNKKTKEVATTTYASYYKVVDGESSHTWIRYSNHADGTAMDMNPTGKKYVGFAITEGDAKSPLYTEYSWSLIKGEDGIKGEIGPNGLPSYLHIKYSDDGKTFTDRNGEEAGSWIGTYTDSTKDDSNVFSRYNWVKVRGEDGYTPIKGTDYFDGEKGQDGLSSYLWVRYSLHSNGTDMGTDPQGMRYIGISTTETSVAPTRVSDYRWSLIKGTDGIEGKRGPDGQSSYLHVKYSNDGGQSFTADQGEEAGQWIGVYIDFIKEDSKNVLDYTWNKVKGEKGDKGEKGVGISGVENYYLATDASSGITTSTGGWTKTIQSVAPGKKYLWNYEIISYTSGSPTITSPIIIGNFAADGSQGKGISGITEYYQVSNSQVNAPGTWVGQPPLTTPTNRFLWNYEKIEYTDNSVPYESPKRVIGVHGEKGATGSTGKEGKPGAPGAVGPVGPNGLPSYLHTAWADSALGAGFNDKDPTGKDYIGTYSDSNSKGSGRPADYKWVKIKGETGPTGPITYTWIAYADNSSGGGITTNPAGKTYVGYLVNQRSETVVATPANASRYQWQLVKGDRGQQGIQGGVGPKGNPVYTWVKYADSPTSGMSNDPTGKLYIGMRHNNDSPTESTRYGDYAWSEMPQNIEIGGRNWIAESTATVGYLRSTGTINTMKTWRHTDFIPVKPKEDWIVSGYSNLGREPSTVYYSASKVYLSGTGNRATTTKFTIPSGTSFMRFSFEDKDYGSIKLEKGNKATDWTPAPEDVDQKIEDIEIGGRNLLPDSLELKLAPNWLGSGTSVKMTGESIDYWRIEATDRVSTFMTPAEFSASELVENETYTVSCEVRIPEAGSVSFFNNQGTVANVFADKWTKISWTYVYTDRRRVVGTTYGGKQLDYRRWKLEKGNKATDWTPAPEDIDKSISTLEQNAKGLTTRVQTTERNYSTIEQRAGRIESRVQSTEGDISTLEQSAKGFTSRVGSLEASPMIGGGKVFNRPLSFGSGSHTNTGYLIIETPIRNPHMVRLNVSGYNYVGARSDLDLTISFHSYTTTQFVNTSFTSSGNYPIDKVQLGKIGGRTVIIIGNPNSAWSYPKITVDKAVIGHGSVPDSYKDGWSGKFSNSLSGIGNIVNVSGADVQSQIKQTNDAIDLRVKTSDLMNRIRLDKSGVLIQANKIEFKGHVFGEDATFTGDIRGASISGGQFNVDYVGGPNTAKGSLGLDTSGLSFYEESSSGTSYGNYWSKTNYSEGGIDFSHGRFGIGETNGSVSSTGILYDGRNSGGLGGAQYLYMGFDHENPDHHPLPGLKLSSNYRIVMDVLEGPNSSSPASRVIIGNEVADFGDGGAMTVIASGMATSFYNLYLGAGGETKLVTSAPSTWGTPSERFGNLRAQDITAQGSLTTGAQITVGTNGRILNHNNGERLYLQANGDVSATKYRSGTLVPMRASAFNSNSLLETKQDISPWKESVLNDLRESELYSYRLIDEVKDGYNYTQQGFVIGKGYKTPDRVLSRDGEGVSSYGHSTFNTKAIKEVLEISDKQGEEITELKKEVAILRKQMDKVLATQIAKEVL